MGTIKIGVGRLYAANELKLPNDEDISIRFEIGTVYVTARVGRKISFPVFQMRISAPESAPGEKKSVRSDVHVPSGDVFPADNYLELVATSLETFDDDMCASCAAGDENSISEVSAVLRDSSHLFSALNYVGGLIALRLHHSLLNTWITEQHYIFAAESGKVRTSVSTPIDVVPPLTWTMSTQTLASLFGRPLVGNVDQQKAAEVFAWLLRAIGAEDTVLKFAALFIALEISIPPLRRDATPNRSEKSRLALLDFLASQPNTAEHVAYVNTLKSSPLAQRFADWVRQLNCPTAEHDIATFALLNGKRNAILHQGDTGQTDDTVEVADLESLRTIAFRYVAYRYYGDTEIFALTD